jgi:VWFA-related protein
LRIGVLCLISAVTILPAAGFTEDRPIPVFTAKIEMVTVDAVVVDFEGRPIRGLTRDDFVLFEDGVAQEIAAFEAIEVAPAANDRPKRGAVASNAPRDIRLGRQMVVVFDEAHLSPSSAEAAKAAVAKLVEAKLCDGDEISLVTTDKGSWWEARMPEDRDDVLAVVRHFKGRPELTMLHHLSEHEAARILAEGRLIGPDDAAGGSGNGQGPPAFAAASIPEVAGLGDGSNSPKPDLVLTTRERVKRRLNKAGLCELNCDAQIDALAEEVLNASVHWTRQTLGAFTQAVELLAACRGRKTLVLVSEGFASNSDVSDEIRLALDAAHRANVAVYLLDMSALAGSPDGLAERSRAPASPGDTAFEMMADALTVSSAMALAKETGGFSLRHGGGLESGLERIASEAGNYYLMGYLPQVSGRHRRKLKVEVRRDGARVRARKTFLAQAEKDDKQKSRHQSVVDPTASREGKLRLGLRMSTYVMEQHSPGKALVLVASGIEPNATKDKVEFLAEVTNRDTGESFEFEKTLKPERPDIGDMPIVQFYLPEGIYQSRIIVREKNGSKRGLVSQRFEVPAVDGWRVTTPILTDLLDDGRPVIVAKRSFVSMGWLYFQIQVYGRDLDCKIPVSSGYVLFGPDGNLARWGKLTPITPEPSGRITRLVGLLLDGFPTGEYELVLVVEDEASGQSRELHERFTVVDS